MNKLTTKDFIERAKQTHGDVFDYSETQYTYSTEKVVIGCPVHGKFKQRAARHLNGSICPKCAKLKSKASHDLLFAGIKNPN